MDAELWELKHNIDKIKSWAEKADVVLYGVCGLPEDDPVRVQKIKIAEDLMDKIHDEMCGALV